MSGSMDVVMSTVKLSPETIKELTANAVYGARILEALRLKVVERFDGLQRVKIADVLTLVENEIEAYNEASVAEHWTKPSE